jgi:hypothetical protein
MKHAWCRDPSRDAAVRAAEDGRTGPLPTLGDAIAGVFEHKAGEAMSGMRTERVVLEIKTEQWRSPLSSSVLITDEQWESAARHAGIIFLPGESVRVVEELHFDDLAQVAIQRDAAIRERDELKSRVAELEARISTAGEVLREDPAASGGGDHFADASKMVEQPRGWLTEEERLALDAARTILDGGGRTNIGVTIDALLARSSSPEVVRPNEKHYHHITCASRDADWIAALAAAGVAVKEVPRE